MADEENKTVNTTDLFIDIFKTLDYTKYNVSVVAKAILFHAISSKGLALSYSEIADQVDEIVDLFHAQAEAKRVVSEAKKVVDQK